jgi:16S rRNA (guanine966-N2)-methyltransferase
LAAARITGGTLRGRSVRVPGKGEEGFRPSAGRLREALFNILGTRVRGARFLDLYAGAGIVGFEAVSRGAVHVTFVEASRALAAAIRQRAVEFGVSERVAVEQGRLPGVLHRIGGLFDIAFLDPPYGDESASRTLEDVSAHLAEGGLVVYEHGSRYNPPERPAGLRLVDRRMYGDGAIGLYERTESA